MNVCRGCTLNLPNEDMQSVFVLIDEAVSIANVLIICARIQVFEDDGLSSFLCRECYKAVDEMYQFIKKVQLSDRNLRKALGLKCTRPVTWVTEEYGKANSPREKDDESQTFSDDCTVEESVKSNNHIMERFDDENPPEEIYVSEFNRPNENFRSTRSSNLANYDRSLIEKTSGIKSYERSPNKETDEVRSQLNKMLQKIELEGVFPCCGCLKTFNTKSEQMAHSMQAHLTKNSSNIAKGHVCDTCHRRYSSSRALLQHTKLISNENQIYECIKCHKRYAEASKARQHVLETHLKGSTSIELKPDYANGRKICCGQACGMSFENEELLLAHSHHAHRINKIEFSLAENSRKPAECYVCFKRFETELSLERHQHRNYKPLSYQCAVCGLKFRGGEALAVHERSHLNEKPFKCDTCQKSFASKTVLKAHRVTHSDQRSFVCEMCGRGFRRKRNLQVHVLSHSNEQPFECDLCSARFKAKTHLNYHMRTHTGEKPYQCRYCEKSFADHTNRARHETSHTGIKPYECLHCDKTFIRKRFLVEHESTHTGIKPYRCETCDQYFNQKAALNAHVKTHPEEMIQI